MAEITYQMMLSTLQTLGILVGIFYYIMTLRNNQKNRKMEMLQRIYESRYDAESMIAYFQLWNREWDDFDDYREKYSSFSNPEEFALFVSQEAMLDGLGILVQNGMVDLDSVYSMMGRRVITFWVKFETIIKGQRHVLGGLGPDYSKSFEYLANELIKIRKKKGLPLYIENLHPTSTLDKELNPI